MSEMEFSLLVECTNPMEAELVPATLREREIPHRTEWSPTGALRIFVPADWLDEAQAALQEGRRIFFGGRDEVTGGRPKEPAVAPEESAQQDEVEAEYGGGESWLLQDDGLYPPQDLKLRPVWPAWVLAAIPGLGLGHLYAGKFQIFIYLVFASAVGVAIYSYTHVLAAFGLVVMAWAADVGFAAFHVKEHNRRAERLLRRMQEKEESFLRDVARESDRK